MFLDVHTLSIREADIAFASELQRGDEPSAARSGDQPADVRPVLGGLMPRTSGIRCPGSGAPPHLRGRRGAGTLHGFQWTGHDDFADNNVDSIMKARSYRAPCGGMSATPDSRASSAGTPYEVAPVDWMVYS